MYEDDTVFYYINVSGIPSGNKLIERFSYDLEMFMCEQNANNRLNEHTQTRAGFDWSCEHAMFSSELKVIFRFSCRYFAR